MQLVEKIVRWGTGPNLLQKDGNMSKSKTLLYSAIDSTIPMKKIIHLVAGINGGTVSSLSGVTPALAKKIVWGAESVPCHATKIELIHRFVVKNASINVSVTEQEHCHSRR